MSSLPPEALLRVAVFASGAGSTFAALVDAGRAGSMPAKVVLLIVSQEDVPAARLARELGVDCAVIDDRVTGVEEADLRAVAQLTDHDVGLVILAGYLRKIGPTTLAAFNGRMLNTHPAPLPAFGGKGMFGPKVHQAVLDAGIDRSAATIHLVDGDYDTGPVIAEASVPVLAGDDVQSLQTRVQAAERELLVATIDNFARTPSQSIADR